MEIRKYLLACFIVSASCNLNVGYKNPQQVSKNIQEAEEKNVLVNTYKIQNVQVLDTLKNFPFEAVWREKSWHLELDKNDTEIPKINESAHHEIVFKSTHKNNFITADNILNWVMWDNNEHPSGTISGMVTLMIPRNFDKDTLSLTIFKQATPTDKKNNLTPLFKFDIVKE